MFTSGRRDIPRKCRQEAGKGKARIVGGKTVCEQVAA
jgi:hypothetical protein